MEQAKWKFESLPFCRHRLLIDGLFRKIIAFVYLQAFGENEILLPFLDLIFNVRHVEGHLSRLSS